VMLYKLPVFVCLIHSSLFDLIEDLPSERRAEEQDARLPHAIRLPDAWGWDIHHLRFRSEFGT
jgi:hypothetical protein